MKGKTNSWFGLILATGLAAVFIAHDLPAAKPGKPGGSSPPPPPPPGRIYAQSDYDVWGMKSDGSQASIEAFIDADWYRVQPSFARFGSDGHRWFLVRPVTHPMGKPPSMRRSQARSGSRSQISDIRPHLWMSKGTSRARY